MKKFISDIEYLALPYSDANSKVMDFRAAVSDIICADLMNQGRTIYAPITSCHYIAKSYGLPRNWEFWKKMDEEFVRICKKVLVVTLKGWQDSTGVTAELKIASEHNIPVGYVMPIFYLEKMKETELGEIYKEELLNEQR